MKKIEKYEEVSKLWLEYKNALKFYLLKKVKNEDLANELAHEVLMKVYKSCCSGNEIRNLRSWMFQIAHNTTIDYLKKENKFTYELPEIIENNEENSYKEAEELLQPLIKLLPNKYALPLQLADIEQLKQTPFSKTILCRIRPTSTSNCLVAVSGIGSS